MARIVLSLFIGATVCESCGENHDCSLNGICSDGACLCDVPWTGQDCGELLTEPAHSKGVYGYTPNISSWGGNIVSGDDGMYHLYVAEMAEGGLKGWSHHSQCAHAVSPNVSGPFQKVDLVLGKWCHNPAPIRGPHNEYMMFHIGSGDVSPSSGFMHYSMNPAGPWTPATTKPGSCNNPAPAFHPNGTLFLICDHMYITSTTPSPSWDGEWQPKRHLGRTGGENDCRHWEDPTLWIDRRGNFHILYHVFCMLPYSAHKEYYSGHAFSSDGLVWTFSDTEPFNGTVRFADGSETTFSTRERPQVIFAGADEKRTTPVGVVGGVSSQPIGPMCDGCYKSACSQCKITQGRDWTYTVLEPLQGFNKAFLVDSVAV